MPKIAQYGEQQIQTGVTKGPQANELPVGLFPASQLSASLGDVATAANKIATRVSQTQAEIATRVSQTQAEEALVKFERAKNDMMFNPESGYLNKQGKTAYDQAKPTSEALDKLMRDHADSITNPEARNAFLRVASQHVTSAQATVMQHASKGLSAWEVDTLNAQVENVIENAALYRNDPKNLAVQRQLGVQTLLDSMDRQGITGDARKKRVQNFESAFAGATITAAISDGASKGKAAFEKYGSNLKEPERIKMKKHIEDKQKQEHSQYVSTIGVNAGRGIVDRYYDQGLDAALKAVESKFKDPEARRAVENEVMAGFRRNDYMKQRTESDAADKAENYLLDTNATEPRTVNGFKAQHPDLWAAMSTKAQRNLEAGVATVTDQTTLNTIKSLPMNQLATLDMAQYVDRLSTVDRKDVWKMIDDARAGKHDIQLQTDAQLIKTKAKQYGLNEDEQQVAFEAVNAELNKTAEAKGSLSDAERRSIVTDTLSEFKVRRGQTFWRGDREEVMTIENTPVPDLFAMNRAAGSLTANLSPAEQGVVRGRIAEIRDELLESDLPVNAGTIRARYQEKYGTRPSKVSEIPK